MKMEYILVEWMHKFDDEPNEIYSEIDETRNEIRKIEIFKNGKIGYATESFGFGGSCLSECPLPEIEEIAKDSQFRTIRISREEFEAVWNKNVFEGV
jgi:hypothetical protein